MKEYKRRVQVGGRFVELEGNVPIPEVKKKKRGLDYAALPRKMRVNECFLIKGSAARSKVARAFREEGVPFVIRMVEGNKWRWRIWKTGEAPESGPNLAE